MKIHDKGCDETFETGVTEDGEMFWASIDYETNQSQDGGYTFERETPCFGLTVKHAEELRDELNDFLS